VCADELGQTDVPLDDNGHSLRPISPPILECDPSAALGLRAFIENRGPCGEFPVPAGIEEEQDLFVTPEVVAPAPHLVPTKASVSAAQPAPEIVVHQASPPRKTRVPRAPQHNSDVLTRPRSRPKKVITAPDAPSSLQHGEFVMELPCAPGLSGPVEHIDLTQEDSHTTPYMTSHGDYPVGPLTGEDDYCAQFGDDDGEYNYFGNDDFVANVSAPAALNPAIPIDPAMGVVEGVASADPGTADGKRSASWRLRHEQAQQANNGQDIDAALGRDVAAAASGSKKRKASGTTAAAAQSPKKRVTKKATTNADQAEPQPPKPKRAYNRRSKPDTAGTTDEAAAAPKPKRTYTRRKAAEPKRSSSGTLLPKTTGRRGKTFDLPGTGCFKLDLAPSPPAASAAAAKAALSVPETSPDQNINSGTTAASVQPAAIMFPAQPAASQTSAPAPAHVPVPAPAPAPAVARPRATTTANGVKKNMAPAKITAAPIRTAAPNTAVAKTVPRNVIPAAGAGIAIAAGRGVGLSGPTARILTASQPDDETHHFAQPGPSSHFGGPSGHDQPMNYAPAQMAPIRPNGQIQVVPMVVTAAATSGSGDQAPRTPEFSHSGSQNNNNNNNNNYQGNGGISNAHASTSAAAPPAQGSAAGQQQDPMVLTQSLAHVAGFNLSIAAHGAVSLLEQQARALGFTSVQQMVDCHRTLLGLMAGNPGAAAPAAAAPTQHLVQDPNVHHVSDPSSSNAIAHGGDMMAAPAAIMSV